MGLLIGGDKGPNIETGSSGMTERHQEILESHDPAIRSRVVCAERYGRCFG
jgi:hypothetical protein